MKNVSRGLASRTQILKSMESGKATISAISGDSKLGRGCVGYHLKLLLKQKTVRVSVAGREGYWSLTKYGQAKLS